MQSRIVLVSGDSDFFEYIFPKLLLRKNDEVFRYDFNKIPEKLHLLTTSVIIINSENEEGQTLELLKILKTVPAIVFSYNKDEKYMTDVIKNGALAFVTPLTGDDEFKAYLASALNMVSILNKNEQYREILVKKNLIMANNEVMLDYNAVLDSELEKIQKNSYPSVLAAISPDDKTKFLLQPNQIETIILENIRKNDILMNYAVNKYFLLLHNTDIEDAEKIWTKICSNIPAKIYAGFAKTFSKSRQQLVNEALNKLHEAINCGKIYTSASKNNNSSINNNFKMFRQEFNKNIEKVVNPVFYRIVQKYKNKLFGVTMEFQTGGGFSVLHIKGRHSSADFKITCPGFSKINIDITFIGAASSDIDSKRVSLNPEEMESGLLEDLLEQFILEFKKETENGTT